MHGKPVKRSPRARRWIAAPVLFALVMSGCLGDDDDDTDQPVITEGVAQPLVEEVRLDCLLEGADGCERFRIEAFCPTCTADLYTTYNRDEGKWVASQLADDLTASNLEDILGDINRADIDVIVDEKLVTQFDNPTFLNSVDDAGRAAAAIGGIKCVKLKVRICFPTP